MAAPGPSCVAAATPFLGGSKAPVARTWAAGSSKKLPACWCSWSRPLTWRRNSSSPAQASSRKASHWSGGSLTTATNRSRTLCASGLMASPFTGPHPSMRHRGGIRPAENEESLATQPVPGRAQAAVQPGAGVGPVRAGGGATQAHHFGGLVDGQAGEVTQLDELGRLRVLGGETLQGVVEVQHLVRRRDVAQLGGIEFDAPQGAAALLAPLAADVLDEDAAHGLGGRAH